MKITKIKSLNNKFFDTKTLAIELETLLLSKGFIAYASSITSTSFKLSNNKSSFRLNVVKLGHNIRRKYGNDNLIDYKRTNVPTWDQRVEYNETVQKFFDDKKLSCKIVSGIFTIRSGIENMNEGHWYNQSYGYRAPVIETMPENFEAECKLIKAIYKDLKKEELLYNLEHNVHVIDNQFVFNNN